MPPFWLGWATATTGTQLPPVWRNRNEKIKIHLKLKRKFRGDKKKTLGNILLEPSHFTHFTGAKVFLWSEVTLTLTSEGGPNIISPGDNASSHGTCRGLHLLQQSTSLPDKPEMGTDPREKPPSPRDVSLGRDREQTASPKALYR